MLVNALYKEALKLAIYAAMGMVLSLSRQVLILIPALLILPRFYGLDGVLIAAPFSDVVSLARGNS